MGVAGKDVLRFRDAHQIQHPFGFLQRLAVAFALMQANRLGNLFAHREHRVQRGHRLLEDHRHIRPANAAQLGLTCVSQIDDLIVAPAQPHFTAVDAATALLYQPH